MSVNSVHDELACGLLLRWRNTKYTLGLMMDMYLIGCYVYYKLNESWQLDDHSFDWVCAWLHRRRIPVRYKSMITRSALKAGTGYHINKYPTRIKELAKACIRNR